MKTNNTFMIIFHTLLLRMRNVSNDSCRENQNTRFVPSNVFLTVVPFMS